MVFNLALLTNLIIIKGFRTKEKKGGATLTPPKIVELKVEFELLLLGRKLYERLSFCIQASNENT